MGIITREDFKPGDFIRASDLNADLNRVYQEVNGRLDRSNIATRFITIPLPVYIDFTGLNDEVRVNREVIFPNIAGLQSLALTGISIQRYLKSFYIQQTIPPQNFPPRRYQVSVGMWSYSTDLAQGERLKAIDLPEGYFIDVAAQQDIVDCIVMAPQGVLIPDEVHVITLWLVGVLVSEDEA